MSMVCGLDLHRGQITFDALEVETGEVWRGRVWQPDRHRFGRWLQDELAPRAHGGPVEVAVEGCTGWRYVVEEITAAGFTPHLAEPAETMAARGRKRHAKTDRSDSGLLRDLVASGDLPESWIPPEVVLEWRERVRLYKSLVDQRTQWVQRIHAELYHHGVAVPENGLRTAGTWPGTKALYCYPVPADEWPAAPDIVERVPLRSCVRRGAAIDIVAARFRENRSQLVFTTARGRDAVFWQSPRTRKQARPSVNLPTARAAGITELEIIVDAHERYAYRFAGQQVRTTSRALPCGDYGIVIDGSLVAAVERKSMPDLIASLTSGRLRYALGELAALPRAAVVVEDRYSQIYKQERVRPALVADGIAECQIRWPNVAIVFCETRGLAEEWTYRYLAAAHTWASSESAALDRIVPQPTPKPAGADQSGSSPAEIRAWARNNGIDTPQRGPIPTSIRQAWERSTAVEGPHISPPDVVG